MVKKPPTMRETWVQSLCWEDPLEEGIAIHPSILAWRIPMDRRALADYNPLQRVGHYWATKHSTMWTKNLKRKKNFLIFNVIKQKNIIALRWKMPDLLPLAVSCVMLACQHLFSSGAPVLSTLYVICPLTKILIRLLSILEYIFIEIKLMSSIILVSQVQYNIISIYLKTINLVNIHHHT